MHTKLKFCNYPSSRSVFNFIFLTENELVRELYVYINFPTHTLFVHLHMECDINSCLIVTNTDSCGIVKLNMKKNGNSKSHSYLRSKYMVLEFDKT